MPGHEVYNEEIAEYAELTERLVHAKETDGLPKKCHEPPVVKRNPTEGVFPTALHVDAAHNPLSDSVVDKLARQLVVDATSLPCAS